MARGLASSPVRRRKAKGRETMSRLGEAKAEKRRMLAEECGPIAEEMNDIEKEIDEWNKKLKDLQEREGTEMQQDSARRKLGELEDRFNDLQSRGEELGKRYKKLQDMGEAALEIIADNFKKRIAVLQKYANIYQELFEGEIGLEIANDCEAEAERLGKLLEDATKEVQETDSQ
ncbi:hypothetical protein ACFLR0_01865 [Candidatus Bipolaricaulota bacterium]